MENLNEILEKFDFRSMSKGQLSFFVGSGISYDSGLPSVNEFIKEILLKMVNQEDAERILKKDIAFEVYMEFLNNESAELLKVYDCGIPNSNHVLMAKLAKQGFLGSIYTTNFDELIEKAMIDEGMVENRDYKVYRTEKDLENSLNDENILKIYKIHGCISNVDSLKHTIKNVANQNNLEIRAKVLEDMLYNDDSLIFMGYSFSDFYDINPIFKKCSNLEKKIAVVNHSKSDVSKKEFLKSYDFHEVFMDTNEFVKTIWELYSENIGGYTDLSFKNNEWKIKIKIWSKNVESRLKNYVISQFLRNVGEWDLSENYSLKALFSENIIERLCALEFYAQKNLKIGKHTQVEKICLGALDHIKLLINELKSQNTDKEVLKHIYAFQLPFYITISTSYLETKRYIEAKPILDKALVVAKNMNNNSEYCILPNYSEYFFRIGYYCHALTINFKLESYYRNSGELYAYIQTLRHVYECYSKLGLEHMGLKYLMDAKNSLVELKDPRTLILEAYINALLLKSDLYFPADINCDEKDPYAKQLLFRNLMFFKRDILKNKLLK
ncbi:SIR2 family protein [Methanococcus maripaludis]|uniref:NAD-dependent protein deacetylase n=1 Tax=Methanococcus maripaludis TaxID=39152 RepID=A0A2L1CAA0_METMI|nr:SIR2 family protein [Methanococcus maripaludis]AVB76291.1 NAD-dependent protein deacetylase [Methanococcus maripaludis]